MTKDEIQLKINQLDIEQHVLKIMINSLYGALGEKFFPAFNAKLAASVTSFGRFFIRQTAELFEKYLQKIKTREEPYVIYGDTDSLYITLEGIIPEELSPKETVDYINNTIAPKFEKIVEISRNRMADIFNTKYPEGIQMEREVIASHCFFTGKKNYFALVIDDGMYHENPKLKMTGIETVKGGTPQFIKEKLTEAIRNSLLMETDELVKWRKKVKEEYRTKNVIEISPVKGVTKTETTGKNMPQGIRAVKAHNDYVTRNNIQHRVPLISPMSKNYICYLKLPNDFNSEVIMYNSDYIADVIQKNKWFDWDKNFEKFFNTPLMRILNFKNLPKNDTILSVDF